jgi:hypothetical protein
MGLRGPALAIDDGARVYWKGRAGTHGVSFQYLRMDMNASGTAQFDPAQFIYPNSDAGANIFIASYAHHFTMPLIKRPSSVSVAIAGGGVDANIDTNALPPNFLPPGITPGNAFSQSSAGIADPNSQLVINIYGTPPLKSNVDLLNYEPTWTLDFAGLLAFPIGEYSGFKMVNMGLNRWYGRIAIPFKYHFRVFSLGYMTSFELIPAVWLFADNGNFIGQTMANDPMWQIEAHLTHDFTTKFFASLDVLYRGGFQSKINGVEVGDDLDIGNLGLTMQFQATDNLALRAGFSTNVFGDSGLNSTMVRLQFIYGWHKATENAKKLSDGH